MKRIFFVLFSLLTTGYSFPKVLIFTYSYNRPDFIEMQHKTFEAFLEDEYEFVVFNDARDHRWRREIDQTCNRLGVRCIPIPQAIHDRPYLPRWPGEDYNHPTVRNCNVVQYSLDVMGFAHDDILVLLDSDIFLVKPISIRLFLKGYDIGGRRLGRGSRIAEGDILYLWHGLSFLDMRSMPNKRTLSFNCGRVEDKPVDAGGHSYYYFKNNPGVKAVYVNHHFSDEMYCNSCVQLSRTACTHNTRFLQEEGFDEHQIAFLQSAHNVEFFLNNSFMHYRCGSNWDYQSNEYHQKKTKALQIYFDAILSEYVTF